MKMYVGDSPATYRYLVRCGSDEDERVRNPFSAGLMRNSSTTTAHTHSLHRKEWQAPLSF